MLQTWIKLFLNSSQKILLLNGSAGSGKTFYCQRLITEHQAIYIALNKARAIVENTLGEQKVTTDQNFLLILDGYEELGTFQNIYHYFNLHRWRNAKVIVTCRAEYFVNVYDYRLCFVPFRNQRAQWQLFSEVKLEPSAESFLAKVRDKKPEGLFGEWVAYHQTKYKHDSQFVTELTDYCIAVAQELRRQNTTTIVYRSTSALFVDPADHWQKYFAARFARLRLAAPLIKTGDNQYEFVSSSLIGFLAPKKTTTTINNALADTLCFVRSTKIVTTNTPSHLSNHYLNQRLITRDVNMINLLADRVWQDEQFKELLFELVFASRHDESMQVAAANAITVLNAARMPFSGMDLSGIRIPNADLTGGIFDHTNLENSNLENNDFTNVFLGSAILRNARLKNIDFKERPSIELEDEVNKVTISPDGLWLAVAGEDVYVWNLSSIQKAYVLKKEEGETFDSFVFNHDSSIFTSVYNTDMGDSLIKFFRSRDNFSLAKISCEHKIDKILFSKNGLYFMALAKSKELKGSIIIIWNVVNDEIQKSPRVLSEYSADSIIDFDVCYQTRYLAVGFHRAIFILDFISLKKCNSLVILPNDTLISIKVICFQLASGNLIALTGNGVISIWDPHNGAKLQTIVLDLSLESSSWIRKARFDFSGTQVAISEKPGKNKFSIWNVGMGNKDNDFYNNSRFLPDFVFSPNGKYIFTVSFGTKKIRILDIFKNSPFNTLMTAQTKIMAVGVMSQSDCCFLVNERDVLETWCLHTYKLLQRQFFERCSFVEAMFSGAANWLALAGSTLVLYKMQARYVGIKKYVFQGSDEEVEKILFSNDELYVVIYSENGFAVIYDLNLGVKQSTITNLNKENVESLAFSENSQYLYVIDKVNKIHIYDVLTGSFLRYSTEFLPRPLNVKPDSSFWVQPPDLTCVSQDAKYLVSTSAADAIRFFRSFNTSDGKSFWLLQQHFPPRLQCRDCDVEKADLEFAQAGVLKQHGAKGLTEFDPIVANRATLLNVLRANMKTAASRPSQMTETKASVEGSKTGLNRNTKIMAMMIASDLMAAKRLTAPNNPVYRQSEIAERVQRSLANRLMSSSLFSPNIQSAASLLPIAPADDDKKKEIVAQSRPPENNKK